MLLAARIEVLTARSLIDALVLHRATPVNAMKENKGDNLMRREIAIFSSVIWIITSSLWVKLVNEYRSVCLAIIIIIIIIIIKYNY